MQHSVLSENYKVASPVFFEDRKIWTMVPVDIRSGVIKVCAVKNIKSPVVSVRVCNGHHQTFITVFISVRKNLRVHGKIILRFLGNYGVVSELCPTLAGPCAEIDSIVDIF